jgi:hypothetical protein
MDNIFHFTQNVYEANHNNNLTCALVFDVQKAFDKVWHAGLLFKMHLMRIPKRIGFWVKNFLENPCFYIVTYGCTSEKKHIKAGVPQGAILSPLLF